MEGTELRALVPFAGSLYAGIGYWEDKQGFASENPNPHLPGAQVLRLDGPDGGWQVDMQLDDVVQSGKHAGQRDSFAIAGLESLRMTTDARGQALSPPVELLAATTWAHSTGLHIYVRSADDPNWIKTVLDVGGGSNEGRAFATHVDGTTGISNAVTGSNSGIFSGAYHKGKGTIVWSPQAEPWNSDADEPQNGGWRVMSFVDCDGSLYATIGPALYQRQDGPSPTWKKVYTYPPLANASAKFLKDDGGLRGAHCLANPDGHGSTLLVAVGGTTAKVLTIDPRAGFAEAVDRNVIDLLTTSFGLPVTRALLAYNHFTPAVDPVTGEHVLLIGVEVLIASSASTSLPLWHSAAGGTFLATANYLVRHADGSYDVFTMADPSGTSAPPRVSVRTLAISPFASDSHEALYAGGFDCNHTPEHNTAWGFRAQLATALGH
jgi:hypothetical protein